MKVCLPCQIERGACSVRARTNPGRTSGWKILDAFFVYGGLDVLIINRDADEISQRLEFYYNQPQELHALAERGQASFRRVFDFDAQMEPRFKIMENLLRA